MTVILEIGRGDLMIRADDSWSGWEGGLGFQPRSTKAESNIRR